MSESKTAHVLRLIDLDQGRETAFSVQPTAPELKTIEAELDILSLSKLRFDGVLVPIGGKDWQLTGALGASVVQACVATLDPVKTRIDRTIVRRYRADFEEQEADDVEMLEDETIEALPRAIDLFAVMCEGLALHLPDYPRAPDAEPVKLSVSEPGAEVLTDDEVKPFAGLAKLRKNLQSDPDEGP